MRERKKKKKDKLVSYSREQSRKESVPICAMLFAEVWEAKGKKGRGVWVSLRAYKDQKACGRVLRCACLCCGVEGRFLLRGVRCCGEKLMWCSGSLDGEMSVCKGA